MTQSRSNWITNEEIWEEFKRFTVGVLMVLGPDIDPEDAAAVMLGGDGKGAVAEYLGLSYETVSNVVDSMLDPTWAQMYERLVFPLERAWKEQPDEQSAPDKNYVYLMLDTFTGYYKMGRSNDPQRRVKELNRNIPPDVTKVTLEHWFMADNAANAEAALHDTYADRRVKLEWFDIDRNDLCDILKINGYRDGKFTYSEDENDTR